MAALGLSQIITGLTQDNGQWISELDLFAGTMAI